MKIATWNVNSIAARIDTVFRWVESAMPDVLCMQEIKCVEEKFPRDRFAELGYRAEVFGQQTYNGVAILTRGPLENPAAGLPGDDEDKHARTIAGSVDGIRVVNVYIPNGQSVGSDKYAYKLAWLKRLRSYFDGMSPDTDVLLCGDFNVAPEPIDVHDPGLWEGNVLFSGPEREALESVRSWGFEDTFRKLYPAAAQYTWWDYRAGAFRRNNGLRIDHIWVTPSLAKRCTGIWIDRETRTWDKPSDHVPVLAEFS